MLIWIIIAAAAAIAIYAIVVFNRLVRLRQMANEAWSGIDVQLKRRSDLVPNLVEAVKGYAAHERSTLDEVTALRGAARAMPDADVEGRAKAESALSAGIGRLHRACRSLSGPQGERKFSRIAETAQRSGG